MYYTPTRTHESDESLRTRVLYVGGDGHVATARINAAVGDQLDVIAASFNLKRRTEPAL